MKRARELGRWLVVLAVAQAFFMTCVLAGHQMPLSAYLWCAAVPVTTWLFALPCFLPPAPDIAPGACRTCGWPHPIAEPPPEVRE